VVKKATFNTKVYPFSEKNIKVLLIFADFLAYFRNYTYLCTPKATEPIENGEEANAVSNVYKYKLNDYKK